MAQEILTPEEFAQRLKIGRSTLFEWIRNGVLVPGRHFVKIGRVLRFSWNDDVLFTLETEKETSKEQTKTPKKNRCQQSNINWNY